jgi:hypothetical protein
MDVVISCLFGAVFSNILNLCSSSRAESEVSYSYDIKSNVTNRQKSPTEAGFPVLTSGTVGYGKTKMKMERPRTPLALKEQVLRPKP